MLNKNERQTQWESMDKQKKNRSRELKKTVCVTIYSMHLK